VVFGLPRNTSDRDTIPPTFSENAPFCHAVVPVAAKAGEAPLLTTASSGTTKAAVAAAANERMGCLTLKELSSKSLNTGEVSGGCGER
jgi:hypothetical protein